MRGIKVNQIEFNIGLKNNPYQDEYEIKQLLKRSVFNVFDTCLLYTSPSPRDS